jgi:hypothetical protein
MTTCLVPLIILGIPYEQRVALQDQLTRLILRVIIKYPNLRYYQVNFYVRNKYIFMKKKIEDRNWKVYTVKLLVHCTRHDISPTLLVICGYWKQKQLGLWWLLKKMTGCWWSVSNAMLWQLSICVPNLSWFSVTHFPFRRYLGKLPIQLSSAVELGNFKLVPHLSPRGLCSHVTAAASGSRAGWLKMEIWFCLHLSLSMTEGLFYMPYGHDVGLCFWRKLWCGFLLPINVDFSWILT